jgi:hypothetical protein
MARYRASCFACFELLIRLGAQNNVLANDASFWREAHLESLEKLPDKSAGKPCSLARRRN